MSKNKMILLRGLPGSGKTTLGAIIAEKEKAVDDVPGAPSESEVDA